MKEYGHGRGHYMVMDIDMDAGMEMDIDMVVDMDMDTDMDIGMDIVMNMDVNVNIDIDIHVPKKVADQKTCVVILQRYFVINPKLNKSFIEMTCTRLKKHGNSVFHT
jgi:hypothetical protein